MRDYAIITVDGKQAEELKVVKEAEKFLKEVNK